MLVPALRTGPRVPISEYTTLMEPLNGPSNSLDCKVTETVGTSNQQNAVNPI